MKKKVSIYVKGSRTSTSYYRIYQYFDNIPIEPRYHTMLSIGFENRFFPISSQTLFIKVFSYFYIATRVTIALIKDFLNPPDCIVVHRRFIPRRMSLLSDIILKGIYRKKIPIYWDIDDNIIELNEISKLYFDYMAKISTRISVTYDWIRDEMIPLEYHHKVVLLPTTDGDMYKLFSPSINENRLLTMQSEFYLVWVGTHGNLRHFKEIIPALDKAAKIIQETKGIKLELKVVCNKPLIIHTSYLKLTNIQWQRSLAITEMLKAHVGIMPLNDTPITRGKGGFKLVQYESIGLPVIGSNVGFNKTIINKDCGFLVEDGDLEGWVSSILALTDKNKWIDCSISSYNNWNNNFSYEKNLMYWNDCINIIAPKS